jgi:phasin family protein
MRGGDVKASNGGGRTGRKAAKRAKSPIRRATQDGEIQKEEMTMSDVNKMRETVESFAQKGQQMAQDNYQRFVGSTRENFEKFSQTAVKGAEEMQRLSKENFDAYVQAATVVAKGFENMGRSWMSFTQEAMEQSAAAAKAMLGVRTLREAVDLQTDWAKTSFDKFVSEATKISEQGVKVANEASAPLTARFNVSVERMFKPIAA